MLRNLSIFKTKLLNGLLILIPIVNVQLFGQVVKLKYHKLKIYNINKKNFLYYDDSIINDLPTIFKENLNN